MITAEESLLINIPRIRLCSAYCNYLSVAYQWTDRHEITDLRGCAVVTQFAVYAVQCRIPAVVEKGAVWHTASSNGASKFAPGHFCSSSVWPDRRSPRGHLQRDRFPICI
jgi:hypothetical protein